MSSDLLTKSEKTEDKVYKVDAPDQSCHAEGNGSGRAHSGGMGHMVMMILCCAAPIVLLSLLPVFAKISPVFGGFLSKYALLLCPIAMIFMVPMMMKGRKHKH